MERIVAPSMLSADFGHLDRDTRMIDRSAAQWVHIDVMDGVFVPNISFGFPVMKPIRRATEKLLDVHLMIVEPEKYVARFVEAGADLVTFHYEATTDPAACAEAIRRAGAKVGISIKPATPVEALRGLLPAVDLVLTTASTPAAKTSAALAAEMPPSISTTGRTPSSSHNRRSSRTLSSDPGMNDCPPNPGSTLMTNTRKPAGSRPRSASTRVAGSAFLG